ncbi:MAG: hypothetical protein EXS49_02635 [Candidatus Pacebacteria bacterium]|nr:hypothetical protein [Candidatus Paceibacterota bacterium]
MNLKKKKIGIIAWLNAFMVMTVISFLGIIVYNYNLSMNLRNSASNIQENFKLEKSKNLELVRLLDESSDLNTKEASNKLLGLVLEKSPLYIEADGLKLASQN